MPGTLPSFPSVPTLLGSLPRGVSPPSMPRGIAVPSLPRGVTLPRVIAMPTVPEAPRRLLQDCCSVLDHQTSAGQSFHVS